MLKNDVVISSFCKYTFFTLLSFYFKYKGKKLPNKVKVL